MGRCDGVDTTLRLFDGQLDQGVEGKLADIRAVLAEEKQAIDGYSARQVGRRRAPDRQGGRRHHLRGLPAGAQRFYEIVVRADVGIIDVAWALKDSKSKEVSGLVRQQKMDLKLLDEEFKRSAGHDERPSALLRLPCRMRMEER